MGLRCTEEVRSRAWYDEDMRGHGVVYSRNYPFGQSLDDRTMYVLLLNHRV
jgi:hypothetical protein